MIVGHTNPCTVAGVLAVAVGARRLATGCARWLRRVRAGSRKTLVEGALVSIIRAVRPVWFRVGFTGPETVASVWIIALRVRPVTARGALGLIVGQTYAFRVAGVRIVTLCAL